MAKKVARYSSSLEWFLVNAFFLLMLVPFFLFALWFYIHSTDKAKAFNGLFVASSMLAPVLVVFICKFPFTKKGFTLLKLYKAWDEDIKLLDGQTKMYGTVFDFLYTLLRKRKGKVKEMCDETEIQLFKIMTAFGNTAVEERMDAKLVKQCALGISNLHCMLAKFGLCDSAINTYAIPVFTTQEVAHRVDDLCGGYGGDHWKDQDKPDTSDPHGSDN